MTHKIAVSLTLGSVDIPITVAAAGLFRCNVETGDGTVVATQDLEGVDFEFPGIADGTYTVQACRLTVDGMAMSDYITGSITLSAETVKVDVPVSMTLTATPE